MAHAHRKIRRTDAVPFHFTESILDNPILQRLERNDPQPSAHLQMVHTGLHSILQDAQLIVYLNPDSLESPLCRMGPAPSGIGRNGRLDHMHQVIGGLNGLILPEIHNKAGNPLCPSLLAVLSDDAG